MIYDCLREAQKEDELLQAFLIKYVDSSFVQKVESQEKNQLYVMRRNSVLNKRGYDIQEFDVDIEVYIVLKEYDNVMAQEIIKSMYKDIMHHLVNDPVGDFLRVESFHFEYSERGVLECGVIKFTAHEIEDFVYDFDERLIRIALGLEMSIMGQNRHLIRYNPKPLPKKPPKLRPVKFETKIDVPEQVWFKGQLGKLEAKVSFGGEPVPYGEVVYELEMDDDSRKEIARTSVEDGEADLEEFIIPQEVRVGERVVYATYQPSEEYQKVTGKTTVTIKEVI